jgi:hypothetical protein
MGLVFLLGNDDVKHNHRYSYVYRFYALHKAYKDKVMIMHVDRHWHKFRIAVRNGNH